MASNSDGGTGISGILGMSIFVHIFDIFYLGYGIDAATITGRVLIYTFLAFFIFRKQQSVGRMHGKNVVWFLGTYFFVLVGLPLLREFVLKTYLVADLFTWVNIFTLLFPIWAVYIINVLGDLDPHNKLKGALVVYFILLGLVFILYGSIYTSNTLGEINAFQTTRLNPGDSIKAFGAILIETFSETKSGLERGINSSLQGTFLASQVEEGQNKYGPEIERFDSLVSNRKQYYANEPLDFTGSIVTKNLKDNVTVTMDCFAESATDPWRILYDGENFARGIPGTVVVQGFNSPIFTIRGLGVETNNFFTCRFPSLPPGRYNIVARARFNYEQTGYVRYSFITADDLITLTNEGKTPYGEYGLTRVPESMFTNGPVDITLSPSQQVLPVVLYTDYSIDTMSRPNIFNLGFQIRNNKNKGLILRINSFEYLVPEEISLTCENREIHAGRTVHPGYSSYKYIPNVSYIDTTYTQMCTGTIPVGEVAKLFNGELSEPIETFMSVTANYDYLSFRRIGGISVSEREVYGQ